MAYFAFVCVLLGLGKMGDAPFWVTDLIKDAFNVALLGLAAIGFRLTAARREGYWVVAPDEERFSVSRAEIEGLQLPRGGMAWAEEMGLPSQLLLRE
jgi:hypothetical protein